MLAADPLEPAPAPVATVLVVVVAAPAPAPEVVVVVAAAAAPEDPPVDPPLAAPAAARFRSFPLDNPESSFCKSGARAFDLLLDFDYQCE